MRLSNVIGMLSNTLSEKGDVQVEIPIIKDGVTAVTSDLFKIAECEDGVIIFGEVEEVKPITYSVGQRFNHTPKTEEYILAYTGEGTCSLISLSDGKMWDAGKVKVINIFKITEEEFNNIAAGCISEFELIVEDEQ